MKNDLLAITRKIMEDGFGNANFQVIDQFVSDDFIEHQFGAKNGKEGLKGIIRELHAGLSDLQYVLQKSMQDGDFVWTHYKATAIQSGPFMHMPPSGTPISLDIMDIGRYENGLLVEHWGIPDRFAAMMQLGVFNKK
ncbi:MAG: ester cyclase [Saprospirales bacterium]|nr:ester cyclase [Saprospirales bacterium]MBK8492676.1 ester cyclase [Saprospirales bacterium]